MEGAIAWRADRAVRGRLRPHRAYRLRPFAARARHSADYTPHCRTSAFPGAFRRAIEPAAGSRAALGPPIGCDHVRRRIPFAHPVRLRHFVPHPVPGIHDRTGVVARVSRSAVAAQARRPYPRSVFLLAAHLRRLVRHGRRIGHRDELPVRHELVEVLHRRRQHHRPAAQLRSADRVFPRSHVPRRDAVRLATRQPQNAFLRDLHGRDRHADLDVLDHLRQ